MRALRAVWDFIVGDDPLVAAGVAVAIGVTAAVQVWWLLPIAVVALLAMSLKRAAS